MKFGPVPPRDAVGAILAHSVTAGGKRLKKGRFLSEADRDALIDAGVETVTVGRLDADDIHEDPAADRLAEAATGAGLKRSAAFTGRVNMIAETDGILLYDRAALDAVNAVDEGITLAALPPFSRVAARQMAATAKIIPFAVSDHALRAASPKAPILRIAPFRKVSVATIQTVLDSVKPAVLDKTDGVMAERIGSLGGMALPPRRCPHEEAALTEAMEAARADGADIVVVIGASAIVDRRDVIPAAIDRAGGMVDHFGMPVDPGNLLLIGRIGETPVVGAPGCVRSPKPNGFDWVLERLAAGVPVTRDAVMAMGAGGFLKEIASRPLPRAQAETDPTPAPAAPRVAGLLLAAGQSRRMGPANKLLERLDGKSLVRRAAETLAAAGLDGITVVTGHQADAVRAELEGLEAAYAHNPSYAGGLAESLKRGVSALPETSEAVLIALGDMPRLRPGTVEKLIAAFDPIEGRAICVPVHGGKRGNPVLFSRRFFAEILELSGDSGAKSLIGAYEDQVVEVAVDDPGVLLDLDTPDALAAERARSSKGSDSP
jgi:molybdenum cofactor cytidylyltransferase